MEIIKRKNQLHTFRCLKRFRWAGHTTEIGQTLELKEPDASEFVVLGRVEPDLPPVVECISLVDLTQPGAEKAFTAKKMEKILLKKEQAISLMLERLAIPADPGTWRPWGLRLNHPEHEAKRRRLADDLAEAELDTKLYEIGIHPAQKGGKK